MRKPFSLFFFILLCCSVGLTSCRYFSADDSKITSINIIDRNGLAETICNKDRLANYEQTDFLSPQPYQKVLRVFGRDKNGTVRSTITSYHPNGLIKQYLEAVNSRAQGVYREWHPNGQQKIESCVIGGTADINTAAEESWLFDGISQAWDEEGHLLATIPYTKGDLDGEARYFHSNGSLWKRSPYRKNALHGVQEIFLEDNSLFQSTHFSNGIKEGASVRYWPDGSIAYQEKYQGGLLMEGAYFDLEGKVVAEIHKGNGFRALFGKKHLQALQQFKKGIQEGLVQVFDEKQTLVREVSMKNEEKEGEEIEYYPNGSPRLSMTWQGGLLQGPVKTWYENGNLETQREMSLNKRCGLSSAWYPNGSLMLLEDYENDNLVKGEYYRLGESSPLSKVERGKGIATLFSQDGTLSRKILYEDGKPQD